MADVLTYNSSFVVGATTCGFSVRSPSGYTSSKQANRSITAIPWAQQYSVVLQQGGIQPMQRRYRALVASESDFIALALQVNQTGTLTTPREQSVSANLFSVDRGDSVNPLDTNGLTAVDLVFDILQ